MIPDHERRFNEFEIELSPLTSSDEAISRTSDSEISPSDVPSVGEITSASLLTMLTAAVIFVVIAIIFCSATPPVQEPSTSYAAMRQTEWSGALFGGGILGLPGVLVASGILAPLRLSRAVPIGAGAAGVHYLLGFLLLKMLWETGDVLNIVGVLFFTGGWFWAYALRAWLRRLRIL